MLIKVQNLSLEKKSEFMRLAREYVTNPMYQQALFYACHQDHLLSRTEHKSWDEMNSKRLISLSKFKFHEFVSIKDGKIIGMFYFITEEINGKIHGHESWVWRIDEKTFTFAKDWKEFKTLYNDSCHYCRDYVIMSDYNIEYEQIYGCRFYDQFEYGKLWQENIRCRDGKTRQMMVSHRKGGLC